MKRIIKDYFSFSKKERTAVILLLVVSAGFIALPYFFSVKGDMPVVDQALLDFIEKNKKPDTPEGRANEKKYPVSHGNLTVPSLFYFDPNTIGAEGWMRLGLQAKTAATIIKYRSKGGKFRAAEDIRKIWGLSRQQADRLMPYVKLEEAINHPFSKKETGIKGPVIPAATKSRSPVPVEINTATVDEWKALPGIGEVLANRIVHYREKIGGFGGVLHVKKVYGISDSVFQALLPFLQADMAILPRLDLNTVRQNELAERTAITPETAKGIISYRRQYGPFKKVEDLKNIVFVSDSVFARIKPHVLIR